MSGGLDVLKRKEKNVFKFMTAETHVGSSSLDFQMEQAIYRRKSNGVPRHQSQEGLGEHLLARGIIAIENHADIKVMYS